MEIIRTSPILRSKVTPSFLGVPSNKHRKIHTSSGLLYTGKSTPESHGLNHGWANNDDLFEIGAPHAWRTGLTRTAPPNRAYFDAAADAAAVASYYGGLPPGQVTFADLSTLLQNSHTRVLSYQDARHEHLYPWIDLHPDGKLRTIYCGNVVNAQELVAKEQRAMQIERLTNRMVGDFSAQQSDTLCSTRASHNAEHSVPQSWFGKRMPMRSDLHALFTADPSWNTIRSNHPYGVVRDIRRRNTGGRVGNGFFEPARNKGAVARATLYFLLRYPDEIQVSELPIETLEVLRQWHRAQPPTLWEKHRNAEIAKVQGDRNPLIDHPEWEDLLDFSAGLGLVATSPVAASLVATSSHEFPRAPSP